MMKFYPQQHQFYCGVDLNANTLHACVVNSSGEKVLHKNFQCKEVSAFNNNSKLSGAWETLP